MQTLGQNTLHVTRRISRRNKWKNIYDEHNNKASISRIPDKLRKDIS